MTTLADLIARAHLNPNDPDALAALSLGLHRAGRLKLDMGWLSHATKIIFALGQACTPTRNTGLGRVNIHDDRIRCTRDGAGARVIADAELPIPALRLMAAVLIDAELYREMDGSIMLIIEVSSRDVAPGQPWQWEGHSGRFVPFDTPAPIREIAHITTLETLQRVIIDVVASYMMRCQDALREATLENQRDGARGSLSEVVL